MLPPLTAEDARTATNRLMDPHPTISPTTTDTGRRTALAPLANEAAALTI
jgi:hypothetical protein